MALYDGTVWNEDELSPGLGLEQQSRTAKRSECEATMDNRMASQHSNNTAQQTTMHHGQQSKLDAAATIVAAAEEEATFIRITDGRTKKRS